MVVYVRFVVLVCCLLCAVALTIVLTAALVDRAELGSAPADRGWIPTARLPWQSSATPTS
jgi:hypothetical protein